MSSGKKWKSKKVQWQVPRIPKYMYWSNIRSVFWKYIYAHNFPGGEGCKLWRKYVDPLELACAEKMDLIVKVRDSGYVNQTIYNSYRIRDLKMENDENDM